MIESIDTSLIDWSRAQFAMTAMYHWIFVPLTLGLAVVMGIMETLYYKTGKQLFLVCRRHFRCPACNRRNPCFLYGSHIHCCHVLWMGKGEQAFSSCFYLAYRIGSYDFCLVDSCCQCLDAKSGRHGVQSG